MGNDHLAKNASILALLIAIALTPITASAGGHGIHAQNANAPWAGQAMTMPNPAPYPGFLGGPAYAGCCYTFPIWVVYQCPAVIAGQPGSPVFYLGVNARGGLLGGQPYLYHP